MKLGAPEYIKTPRFKTKTNFGNNSNSNSGGMRRKKKQQEMNDDDWESIRTFQTTEFEKKEGVEYSILLLRKYLNMITPNTYLKLRDDIITEIGKVILINNKTDLVKLTNELFKIVTTNILYSDIYAKLYKDLINEFDIFNEILTKNFENFNDVFETIEYYDPEKSYEKFCENNKKNEFRRALCTFYVNLMKEGILSKDNIANIIIKLFNILDTLIIAEKKNELDELSELIYIMVINSYETINFYDENIGKEIYENVVKITNIKNKQNSGITNKCIFKHMDILDEIS